MLFAEDGAVHSDKHNFTS